MLKFIVGSFTGTILALFFLAACGGSGSGSPLQTIITALSVTFDNGPSGLAADNVQDAINENAGNIAALGGRVTTAENDIDSAEGDIASLETDVNALDTRATVLESRATDLETDTADLDTRVTTLEGAQTGADISYDNSSSGLTATDVQAAIDELASATTTAGSVFIRWGNTNAPSGTTKIYDGIAMSASDGTLFVMKGGDPGGSTSVNTYFNFQATDPDSGTLPTGITADRRVVACVCYCDKPTAVIYGTHTAPSGWTVLYKGYVLSHGTDNIVVDSDSFDASAGAAGGESQNNLRLRRFSTTHDTTNYPASREIKGCVVKKN